MAAGENGMVKPMTLCEPIDGTLIPEEEVCKACKIRLCILEGNQALMGQVFTINA